MSKIAILDMGLNNIKSIYNLSSKFSETYVFSKRNEFIKNTEMLILPGNGNFGKGMEVLNDNGLTKFIRNLSEEIKIVGICLGMQLLMDSSEESPNTEGLSLIQGKVVKIKKNDDYNNPLLGWYDVKFNNTKEYEKLNGCYFFNNSFIVNPIKKEVIDGYLDKLPVFLYEKKIYGIQFHPELSRNLGSNFFKYIYESKTRC